MTEADSTAECGADFAELLDAEGVPPAPAIHSVAIGDEVSGVIVKIEDEHSFVEYGSRNEAVIRTSENKGPDGEMGYEVGDPLVAFVVEVEDPVQLSR